jgi:hypothetical protein
MTNRRTETTEHLLATMQAVSPSLEKMMAERLDLRRQIRASQTALAETEAQITALQRVRDVRIPQYIGIAKAVTLAATIAALIALSLSLFTSLIEIKVTAPLFASLLLPLWLVDHAEQHFGRWQIHVGARANFIRIDG